MSKGAEKPVSATQFWIGMAVTVLGFVVTIYTTRHEVAVARLESQQNHAADGLQHLSDATTRIRTAMTEEAAMYNAMQAYLRRSPPGTNACAGDYVFDLDASDAAWLAFNSTMANLDVYLYHDDEVKLISRLRNLPIEHRARMKGLKCPKTLATAEQAYSEILSSRDAIAGTFDALRATVTNNRRSKS